MLATWVVAAALTVMAIVTAPPSQTTRHRDHIAFAATVEHMRDGEGYYDAYVHAFEDQDVLLGHPRAFRQPWMLLALRAVPDGWALSLFFLGPVLGSAIAASLVSRQPAAGLAAGAWVAFVGVYTGVDAWLLSELWAVPLLLGSCAAWLRGRDGWAAGLACAAVFVREPAVLLLGGLALGAWRADRPLRPYLTAVAACSVALAGHWYVAGRYVVEGGTETDLFIRGGLDSVGRMLTYPVVPWVGLGVAIWVLAVVQLWRSSLRPALALALLPLLGLWIDRGYWGWLVMPLLVVCIPGVADATAGYSRSHAGRESGDISVPQDDIPVGEATRLSPPSATGTLTHGGSTGHVADPAPAPRAVQRRDARRSERTHRRRQGHAR